MFVTEEICGYTIYKTLSDLPFRIVEVDRISGTARIVLAPGAVLDYEKVHQYNFEIAAHDCETGNHAQRSVDSTFSFVSELYYSLIVFESKGCRTFIFPRACPPEHSTGLLLLRM